MLKLLLSVALAIGLSTTVYAAGGGCGEITVVEGKKEHKVARECQHAPVDLTDKQSLQRGAAIFLSYCAGCHTARYQRYSRMANDLDIPKELVEQYMMFTTDKIGEVIDAGVDGELQKDWFGAVPPDLTMATRLHSPDWVYTYLLDFYPDDKRQWGVNNYTYKDVAMPHVLDSMQQQLGDAEYKKEVGHLVNFMTYMAEPIAHKRKVIGVFVILFLLLLLIPVYYLNKEFWKDIH